MVRVIVLEVFGILKTCFWLPHEAPPHNGLEVQFCDATELHKPVDFNALPANDLQHSGGDAIRLPPGDA